ncbi:MAG: FAD-binding oxidoreductase [Bacteroidetes bacterium]|nr:FAD-binding oxidoreductase [Bacteroidota bacterium]MBS1539344.1 FAD-binding oxidoreductase [Bacteroidota bacterium]
MPIKTTVDYIIVGQGLAGSCLALALKAQHKKVAVFDEPQKNLASAIAAGLFNPISGKGLAKSWKADVIFPFAESFYRQAEKKLSTQFYFPMPIYRPFISVEEQNEWMAQSQLDAFIEKIHTTSAFGEQVNDPLGGILLRQSGYVDTIAFISSVRNFLTADDSFWALHFNFDQLKIAPDKVCYEQVEAKGIIFCEGVSVRQNPFFSPVYIKPLKGETLTVRLPQPLPVIFNRSIYLVPTSRPLTYVVGATYKPNDNIPSVTEEGRAELEEKLRSLINLPFHIEHQHWGFRPTVPDRRPVMGNHPHHKNLYLFNGLGTKGVTLAPYCAHIFANWLRGESELPQEVNIKRFKSLYSKFSLGANL